MWLDTISELLLKEAHFGRMFYARLNLILLGNDESLE